MATRTDPSMPNVFLRTGAFSVQAFKGTDRPFLKDKEVYTNDKERYRITFTGEQLNQHDFQVFAALLKAHRAAGHPYGQTLVVPTATILRELRMGDGGSAYGWLWDRVKRLKLGCFEIKVGDSPFVGSLVKEAAMHNHHIAFELSEKLATLFDADCTYIDLDQTVQLKGLMSKWLLGYFGSHRVYIPVPVAKLRSMMDVPDSMPAKQFNRSLGTALKEVSTGEKKPFVDWEIKDGVLSVYRAPRKGEVVSMGVEEDIDPFE